MNATAAADFYSENAIDITEFMATVALFAWTIGLLLCITAKTEHTLQFGQTPPLTITINQDQEQEEYEEPRTIDWNHIGIYHFKRPQTLSKAEREALAVVGGNAAYLYERTHKSGAKSWRYRIGNTWFYPTASAVKRRGLDLFANDTLDIE